MNVDLKEVCRELENVVPNIRWDEDMRLAVEYAGLVLEKVIEILGDNTTLEYFLKLAEAESLLKLSRSETCRYCMNMTYNGQPVLPACDICPEAKNKRGDRG